MKYILRKIQVIMGKCTSHIILILVSALRKLLKLRNNQIIASFSIAERTHMVMNFLPSVNT